MARFSKVYKNDEKTHVSNNFFAIATLQLTACTTVTVSDKAQKVRLHNQMSTLLNACKVIGPVDAEAAGAIANPSTGLEQAKINLREKAFDLGADTVVITDISLLSGSLIPHQWGRAIIQGTAVKCFQ